MAVKETRMGKVEDKAMKNYVASQVVYDQMKNKKSVRVKLINFEKTSWSINFIPFWSRNINLGIFEVRCISGYNSLNTRLKSLFSNTKLKGHVEF